MTADQGIKYFIIIAMLYFGVAFLGAVSKHDFIKSAQIIVAMTYVYVSTYVNREDKHTLYLQDR